MTAARRRAPLRMWVLVAITAVLVAGMGATNTPSAAAAPSPNAAVTSLAYSPDGRLIAVGGDDSRVFLYQPESGRLIRTLEGHAAGLPVTAVAFSPDGRILASASRDSTVRLWDVASGAQLRVLAGHEQAVRAVAFSADGTTLISGGEDTKAMVWEVATGRLLTELTGNGDFVTAVAVSPDGKTFATGTRNARIRLWDAATRSVKRLLLAHTGEVTSLAYAPDAATLASGSTDTTVRLWTVSTGTEAKTLRGHTGAVTSVGFDKDGATVGSGSADRSVLLWDRVAGTLSARLSDGVSPVQAIAFSHSGNDRLVEGRRDGVVRTWDVPTRRPVISFTTPPKPTPPGPPGRAGATATESGAAPAAAAPAAVTDGPGGPVLVVTSGADPFSTYYAEILRAEGLNSFATADIATVSAASLAAYDVVILAARPLDTAQVTTFSDWVTGGGNLIAMRPDSQLAGLLGLSSAAGNLSDAYLQVDTTSAPGNGIVGETMQFHGTADRYTLSGARSVATLYSNASTATSNPAVTLRDVGTSGGQAAAFTYDLARSVVYTRQGNPAWNGQERDGTSPIRSDDLYFGNAAGDPKADWVDLAKVSIPQADEQQRLLANLILSMNADRKPLPRFWYLPRDLNAAVVMTGDDHGNGGTAGRFDQFAAASPPGCSLSDWECIRGTSYIYPSTPLTNTQAAAYTAQGFEVGLHLSTNCADWTPASLQSDYTSQLGDFASKYTSIPAPTTNRTHCIAWSDWSTQAAVEQQHGIRLDTNYYYWPPSWVQNRPGFFTGSGIPMRFTDTTGAMVDTYQAASQMTDESGQTYPFTVDGLLDKATGPEGYYGVFTINAHTDSVSSTEASAAVASAQAHGVPVVTAKQMLTWLDGRNSSSFGNIAWNGGQLSFTATPAAGANNLDVMVPFTSKAGTLASVTRDGAPVTYTTRTVKGVVYAFVRAGAGTFVATYQADTTAPTVTSTSPADNATGVSATSAVTATFSEDMDPATINTNTVQLRDPANNNLVGAAVTYAAGSRTATLTPNAPLAGSATYTATVKGASNGVTDLAGNALATDRTWTFTTAAGPVCPCTIWPSTAVPANQVENDPNAVELGVKFRADVNGYVTGVRFWKGTANSGTHTGTLWTSTGAQLTTATFTGESSSGWQQVSFPNPVAVTAGTTYVASYHTPSGNYAGDNGAFASIGVDNAPLHALRDGLDGANGVYHYGASAFPDQTWQSTNYWVDVVFTTTPPSDTTPPTVTTTSPPAGATGVATTTSVTATFSEDVDPNTINTTTVQLRDPANNNNLVDAAVTYAAGSRTATLTPNAPLAGSATYTATVKGGSNGVKDLAGNALATDRTWSFTTAPAAPTGLTATANASGVNLDWADNTDAGVTGYAVYRANPAGGTFTRITPSVVTASTWEDTLAPSGSSDYRVTALNTAGGESAPSATATAAMAKDNLIVNPGFELDANPVDGRPDSWTVPPNYINTSARFTRQAAGARSGTVGGRLQGASTNPGYTIGQIVTGLTANNNTYDFAGWVNIPATSDAFTFRFNIVWRNGNTVIRTDTVSTLTAPTNGWVKVASPAPPNNGLSPPAGTTNALINMVVTSLNATVYVDDLALRQR